MSLTTTVSFGPMFAPGTSVGAYVFAVDNPDGQPPVSAAVESQVVGADSTATFSLLGLNTQYWLGALVGGVWTYIALHTRGKNGTRLIELADVGTVPTDGATYGLQYDAVSGTYSGGPVISTAQLATETTARTNADDALTTAVNGKASAGGLTAEIAARIAADAVLQAEIDALPGGGSGSPATGSAIPRGNRISFVGDSRTTDSTNSAGTGRARTHAWPEIACALSNGRMQMGLNVATAGHTTRTLTTQITTVLADPDGHPAYCAILMGANDMATGLGGIPAGITPAETRANIAAADALLIANGVEPIWCSELPRGASTGTLTVPHAHQSAHDQVAWLRRFCQTKGRKFVDFYSTLVNPLTAEWATTSDQIHPGDPGIPIMAELFAAVVAPMLPEWSPPLSAAIDDIDNLIPNPLFLTDTNADGVPDNWTIQTGFPGAIRFAIQTAVIPYVKGNVMRMTANPTGATGAVRSDTITSGFAVGDRLGFGFKLRVSLALSMVPIVRLHYVGPADEAAAELVPVSSWKSKIDPAGVVWVEDVVPAGTTGIYVQIEENNCTGQADFAQMTLRNLTVMGPPSWSV